MPSATLVAASEVAPPLRQRRQFESVTLPLPAFRSLALPSSRDWAAGLPPELLSCILHRLGPVQIMLGADKVCRSWHCAARDEPKLWRHIDIRGHDALSDHRNLVDLNEMAMEAVRRSQGQCWAFSGEGYGLHDDFIHFLGNRAPLLKRLILISCLGVSGQGFMQALKGFPLLEELHLSKCWYLQRAEVYEVIAKECPRLKYLRICEVPYGYYGSDSYIADEEAIAMAIAKMQQLRFLQLINNSGLTNQGLETILDNCLHLKSVDILSCSRVDMTPEMEARIKAKKLLMNYSLDLKWNSFDDDAAGSPPSECSTCLDYFRTNYEERYQKCDTCRYYGQLYPIDEKVTKVISTARELCSLELHCNDLTSKGLAAILDKCPHLEPLDVWNCLNIIRNNNALPRGEWPWHRIKTKRLTTKLLMGLANHNVFNPDGLDIRYWRNIVMNSCHGRRIVMDNTVGAKYKRLQLRKLAKRYHERTKKIMACIEKQYLAKLHGDKVDYMILHEAKFESYRCYNFINKHRFETGYNICSYYDYRDWEIDDEEFECASPVRECSTCLMLEYLAERWGVLDLDDYADYYDSSYGLDGHDDTEFQVHDGMLGKRFRRYM